MGNFKIPEFTIEEHYMPFELIPWNIQQINAPFFWEYSKGGGRVVAVIDTGLEVNHPEFKGRVYNPINCTSVGSKKDVSDFPFYRIEIGDFCTSAEAEIIISNLQNDKIQSKKITKY